MWEKLPEEQKLEYKKMMLVFASMSEIFAQKAENESSIVPIINSKYQESVFQRAFKATAEDIGNTSYDVALVTDDGEKYLIGIKTFGISSGAQKIAQFKAKHDEWSPIIGQIEKNARGKDSREEIDNANKELYLELAKKIAKLRNQRIDSSAANIRGFKVTSKDSHISSIYHVLMPSQRGAEPIIYVGEIEYDKIEIDHLKVLGCTSAHNPGNFNFTDGKHNYRYTSADSQLLMDFKNKEIIKESWKVEYIDNAYKFFFDLAEKMPKKDNKADDIIESYSWLLKGHIERFSGFNSFYGVGSKLGQNDRKKRILKLKSNYEDTIEGEIFNDIYIKIKNYLLNGAKNAKEKEYKVTLRDSIMNQVLSTENMDFIHDVKSLLFRPKNEMYIPIQNARQFHEDHPDFFAKNAGKLQTGSSHLELPPDQRKFELVFEPSGDSIFAYITQDNGKAIESCEKQSYLGEWIREEVFQLKEYEPLTDQRLLDMGINGIRLYKKNNQSKIHLEFIWIEEDNLPDDFVRG